MNVKIKNRFDDFNTKDIIDNFILAEETINNINEDTSPSDVEIPLIISSRGADFLPSFTVITNHAEGMVNCHVSVSLDGVEISVVASAKRHPEDEQDEYTGHALALARAMKDMAVALESFILGRAKAKGANLTKEDLDL